MAEINVPNSYPVDLAPPDLSPFRKGNTGIPYVWRFDSGRSGPNVMISAIVHGNEPCGALAIEWLMKRETRPLIGSLTFAFMNIAAYEVFDPSRPDASRWVDEDFNRIWGQKDLNGSRDSTELRRARQVRPALEDIDFLLDLHSMQHPAPPLMMSGRHPRAKTLAAQVGVPERVVGDTGHAAGKRMRDYGQFDDPRSTATALLIECGQHWSLSAGDLSKEASIRFLAATGSLAPEALDAFTDTPAPQSTYSVIEAVTIAAETFTFAQPFSGGEVLAQKGTLIGHDGDVPVVTPEDNVMLVMPSKRLWKGQTAVRLARLDRRDRR